MSGIAPNIPASAHPQQVVKQHSLVDYAVNEAQSLPLDFDTYVDYAIPFNSGHFEPPVVPGNTHLPDFFVSPGTRSTYSELSDASTLAPITPESSMAFPSHGDGLVAPPYDSGIDEMIATARSSWVSLFLLCKDDVCLVDLCSQISHILPLVPELPPACDSVLWQPRGHVQAYLHGHTSITGDLLSINGYSSVGSVPNPSETYSRPTFPAIDTHSMPREYLLDLRQAWRAMGMHQYGDVPVPSSVPCIGLQTYQRDAAVASSVSAHHEGTVDPSWLFDTTAPASRPPKLGFRGQEQPQPQHMVSAATAGAPGQGIGMQVTTLAHIHNHPQYLAPQAVPPPACYTAMSAVTHAHASHLVHGDDTSGAEEATAEPTSGLSHDPGPASGGEKRYRCEHPGCHKGEYS